MSSAYELCMEKMNEMQVKITQIEAENKMLRNNTAIRINGLDEITKLQDEIAGLNKKFNRCDEERAMACRQVEKHKDMWKGQCNRTALLESELANLRRGLEFYAEESNWYIRFGGGKDLTTTGTSACDADGGTIAREALGMGEK